MREFFCMIFNVLLFIGKCLAVVSVEKEQEEKGEDDVQHKTEARNIGSGTKDSSRNGTP